VQSDGAGVITAFSVGAERMFGWSADEVLGRNVEILMPAYYRPRHRAAFKDANESPAPRNAPSVRDVKALHKSGASFQVNIVLHGYISEDGRKLFDAEIRKRESDWATGSTPAPPKG